ncbi:LPXTG cell wall anchor domain-containing protein [Nocardioides terrisoli]|uniref:LPXTG cell wall anchor domain-containing protein n=1 Tax=Nocardioides terrisoli TaxID=3388267 RepID=UPI00287B7297|nr:LPXTG cell wall anchor domain-containing protein [Nocardioides marmorisolisilvae]
MKKIFGPLLAALVSAFALLLVAPSAQAYPELQLHISVSSHSVTSGATIDFSATSAVSCKWTATFAGETQTGNGKSFSGSFQAPSVTKTTVFTLTISCDTGSTPVAGRAIAGHAGNAVMVPKDVVTRSVKIVVHPSGQGAATNSGGGLPNTGGPNLGILGGGLALLVAGAGTVLYTRRRTTHA